MAMGPVRPAAIGGAGGVAPGRARRGGGGFTLPTAGLDATGETGAAAPMAPLGGLLALQDGAGMPAVEPADQRARRRAGMALDELRGLQLDLLGDDGDDAARLDRLERLAAPPEDGLEPALSALMAEVRLRARLELARRGVSTASRK